MIEGTRALPWLQETRSNGTDPMAFDCTTCMQQTDENLRAHMHCGWIVESRHVGDYAPQPHAGYPHNDTTCPGYTTALPDVIGIATAYMHWDKGDVRLATAGAEPSQALADGLITLAQAVNALNCHRAKGDKA